MIKEFIYLTVLFCISISSISAQVITIVDHNDISSGVFEVDDKNRNIAMGQSQNLVFSIIDNGTIIQSSGKYATAFGNSITSADYSFAGVQASASGIGAVGLGVNASASHNYSMALGTSAHTQSNNQLVASFFGGYKLITGNWATGQFQGEYGVELQAGGSSWASLSDINMKENFILLDGDDILSKFEDFNLYTWNYKGQEAETKRHYGIMAQDFFNAFGQDSFGTIGNSTRVNPIDLLGVAYSAIKALKQENDTLKNELQSLNTEIQNIKTLLMSTLKKE